MKRHRDVAFVLPHFSQPAFTRWAALFRFSRKAALRSSCGPRRIHAGISGRRRRGRRSGAILRVQACRPVRPSQDMGTQLLSWCTFPSPPLPGGLLFFASAALRLCVFSCGARRPAAAGRSLRSEAKLVPTRSAAELVGAALALAVVFPLAWAAGQQQHGGRFSVFHAKH